MEDPSRLCRIVEGMGVVGVQHGVAGTLAHLGPSSGERSTQRRLRLFGEEFETLRASVVIVEGGTVKPIAQLGAHVLDSRDSV